jgi:hypothetical protein
MTDGHYERYQEMLEKVDWDKYGVYDGVVRDPRCENCMTHCGYEPTPSLGIDKLPGDTWKLIRYNFGSRPKPVTNASHVDAYNGVTTGRGHLTGKRDSVQPNVVQVIAEREVAAAVAARSGGNSNGCCSSETDEIATAK